MKVALTAALVSSLAVQQATAQYGWGNAKAFSNPYNTDNKCSKDQESGFNWGGLQTGDFGSFGGFDFSGFSCKDSFSKRSLSKRTGFQDKCIEGSATKSDSSPKIACGSDDQFSINEMQVSVSFDTDLDFIYDMPDGSTCKHTSPCAAGGSSVKNTQCGGAKSVTFQLPQHADKDSCDIGIHSIDFDCSPGTTSTSTEASSTPAAASTLTSSVYVSSEIAASSTTVIASSSSSSNLSVGLTSAPPSETVAPTTTSPVDTGVPLTTSTVFSTSFFTVTSCGPEVKSCPARSTVVQTSIISVGITTCPVSQVTQTGGGSTTSSTVLPVETSSTTFSTTETVSSTTPPPAPVSSITTTTTSAPSAPETTAPPTESVTTEIVYTTLTTCPVLATVTSGGSTLVQSTSTISTLTLTSTATVCPTCTASPPPGSAPVSPESTTAVPPPSSSASSPPPPAGCPQVLPSCLNTFLKQFASSCTSNSDSSCYCPNSDYTNAVMQCIQSWGASQSEVQAAMSYFTGICANHVSQNPGIITAVPSTITLVPTPPPASTVTATVQGSAPPAPAQSVPCTTISIATTVTISSTQTSVYTTAVTVPQVQFITTTAAPAPPGAANAATPTGVGSVIVQTTQVGLVPGTTYAPVPIAESSAAVAPAAASTFGTSIIAAPSGNATAGGIGASSSTSSPFAAFTGAASKQNVGMGFAGVAMAAIVMGL